MNNKKLMISLFSLCLVAIVGLLTTVIVLAASTQNVNSSINVTYTASEVSGSVSAAYKVKDDASETKFTGGTGGTITFTATTKTSEVGTLKASTDAITLTSDKNYVEFYYNFTNNGDKMIVKLAAMPTGTNIKFECFVSDSTTGVTSVDETLSGKGSTLKVTFKATIVDTALAASINTNINWALSAK